MLLHIDKMVTLTDFFPSWKQHAHVLTTSELAELAMITRRQYNLAIYSRKADNLLQDAVQILLQSSFKGIDTVLDQHDEWHDTIVMALGLDSATNWILFEPLVNDIAKCCELFTQITHAKTIRLSMKVVNQDACRKFHIDGYTYRLLCSYHGPGTEWVYNDNVNRKYLGEGENEEIVKDVSAIQQINTFDVAILKGELPHQRNGKGIVHRSPPIQHTNNKRLVLRIDCTS
jgi:hypothetical protein